MGHFKILINFLHKLFLMHQFSVYCNLSRKSDYVMCDVSSSSVSWGFWFSKLHF